MRDSPTPRGITAPLARGFGCATAVALAVVVILGAATAGSFQSGVATTLLFAGLLAGAVAASCGAGVTDRIAWPLVVLAPAPVLAAVAAAEVDQPIASLPRLSFVDSNADVVLTTAITVPLGGMLAVALGRFAVRRLLARERPRVFALVRGLAWLAIAASAATLALAAVRLGRPDAARYPSTLPVVAELPAIDAEASRGRLDASGDDMDPNVIDLGGLVLRRELVAGGTCRLSGGYRHPPRYLPPAAHPEGGAASSCGALRVHADPAGRVWVVDFVTESASFAVFPVPDWAQPWTLVPSQIRGAIRPPVALVALAAAGLVAALALLLRGHRSLLPADPTRCKDALPLSEGTLLFADGTPELPLPAGAPLDAQPVVAIFAPQTESFRDHARPALERVVPGTLADHRVAAALLPHARALAVAVITATPLAAALWVVG